MSQSPSCEDDLFCGVNRTPTDDPGEMNALQKKHTPVIEAPDEVAAGEPFEVSVRVGEHREHPNEPGHYFDWMELYSGDTFLARLDLTPEKSHYEMNVTVSLDHGHPIRAVAHCNLHGAWENELDVTFRG